MAPPQRKKPTSRPSVSKDSSKAFEDPRFKNIETDPRFRLPSRKHNRVQLDNRFSRMLQDEDFYQKASVDRYGRKLPKTAGKKALQNFYRLDDASAADDDSDHQTDDDVEVQEELARLNGKHDPAREGGFSDSSSSSSDDDLDESSSDESEDDAFTELEQDDEPQTSREDIPVGEASARFAVVNIDWDHIRAVDLMAVASSFCPPGGKVLKVSIYPSEFGKERIEREETEGPPKELFSAAKSIPAGGQHVQSRTKHAGEDDESDSSEELDDEAIKKQLIHEGDSEDFDPHALRSYQLSRLKYYYAIVTTTSADTALAVYNSMDGREYLSTANFFDLRFVPDDVTFPDSADPSVPRAERARDECTKVPEGYQANDFVTDALTHSKVRLTWDEEDHARKEVQKRAFSRTEIDENDLKAYIGSDESGSEMAEDGGEASKQDDKASQAELARQKMRAALGLAAEPVATSKREKGARPQSGDMQITFSTALSSSDKKDSSVFSNEPEETTRERYIRLERERKARRKAKLKAARDGNEEEDEAEPPTTEAPANVASVPDDADPFADPFFEDPGAANKALQKAAKRAKREKAEADAAVEAQRKEKERRELELLMMDDDANALAEIAEFAGDADEAESNYASTQRPAKPRHFDMREIKRSEKLASKSKQSRKAARRLERQAAAAAAAAGGRPDAVRTLDADDFDVPVADPRFAALYENHEYAIDPTNPRFSGTKGMKSLLEEGRRRRRAETWRDGGDVEREAENGGGTRGNNGKRGRVSGEKEDMAEIEALVKRVKSRHQGKGKA